MPLTVLSVAYPFAPVGPQSVGGAEQILTDLDQALVGEGHTSLVLACEGSVTAGKLFSLPVRDHEEKNETHSWRADHAQAILDRVLHVKAVDLIHVHDMGFREYEWPQHIPVLVTLHLPPSWYPAETWNALPSNVQVQYVSETERLSGPPPLRRAPVIANGVEIPARSERKDNFAIALGRICPEKNQHQALDAGFRANIRVVLGGQLFPWPEHMRYFSEKLKPLLEQKRRGIRHRFCGALNRRRKQRLLAAAKCLLHPTLAPETSSLVAMEALAAGTPVIAYRSGALREIVEDGVTGFLVDSMEEMADAIHRVDAIETEACRHAAAQRFSKSRMVSEYFDLYRTLIGSQMKERQYA
jgi:glycosyltransferase involved in cell wall biosynthesis